jgi:hypothetical protein
MFTFSSAESALFCSASISSKAAKLGFNHPPNTQVILRLAKRAEEPALR